MNNATDGIAGIDGNGKYHATAIHKEMISFCLIYSFHIILLYSAQSILVKSQVETHRWLKALHSHMS